MAVTARRPASDRTRTPSANADQDDRAPAPTPKPMAVVYSGPIHHRGIAPCRSRQASTSPSSVRPRRRCCFSSTSTPPGKALTYLTPDRTSWIRRFRCGDYLDLFGNRVTRVDASAGLVTFSDGFVIQDSGAPDETPPEASPDADRRLPDDTLLFLGSTRYCDCDKLADFAWSQFRTTSGGSGCMQAICGFRHGKIRFDYMEARSTRGASNSLHEGVGVCRDFAHLAIALCRCMNIPARYCTGYLGDTASPRVTHGFQRLGGGLSRRPLVDVGRPAQPSPHRPHRDGAGRDAADVAMSTAFGVANLKRFVV